MSDYTVATNFAAKDALATGNVAKQIRGTELDAEFDAIATAIASKADTAGPTFTGTVQASAVTATTAVIGGLATASQLKLTDPVMVDAYASSNQTSGAVGATITFDTETSDLSADFGSSIFTAPVDGLYLVSVSVYMSNSSGSTVSSYVYMDQSGVGTVANSSISQLANAVTDTHHLQIVLAMTAGQTLTVKNGGTALAANYYVVGGRTSRFNVALIART